MSDIGALFVEWLFYGIIAGVLEAYSKKLLFLLMIGLIVIVIVASAYIGKNPGEIATHDTTVVDLVIMFVAFVIGNKAGRVSYKDTFKE